MPVAKRNFRIRHHHADAPPLPTAGSDELLASLQAQKRIATEKGTRSTYRGGDHGRGSRVGIGKTIMGTYPPIGHSSTLTTSSSMRTRLATVSSSLSLPGSSARRIACKARGMPADHTAETAYFIVHPNMKHGEELICSYESCRQAGVKFCYCVQCVCPVAKRNFRVRHNHCEFVPPPPGVVGNSTAFGSSAATSSRVVAGGLSFSGFPKEYLRTLLPTSSNMQNIEEETESSPPRRRTRRSTSQAAAVPPTVPEQQPSRQPNPIEDQYRPNPRLREWDLLLDRRPVGTTDPEQMKAWLTDVLSTSSQLVGERTAISDDGLSPTSEAALAAVISKNGKSSDPTQERDEK